MTRRTLRLVPKASNVVSLNKWLAKHRKEVVRHNDGQARAVHAADTTPPRLPVVAGADDPRRDAWPYPCDVEPDPAA